MSNHLNQIDHFSPVFWGDDHSTKATFIASSVLPASNVFVSACFVCATYKDTIVMSKPARGWGLIGGHVEISETPEECARREAMEEAAVTLGDLTLVGYWYIEKVIESEFNKKYPSEAYQLLYCSNVTKILDFTPNNEISERAFMHPDEILSKHHNRQNFQEVFDYLMRIIKYS